MCVFVVWMGLLACQPMVMSVGVVIVAHSTPGYGVRNFVSSAWRG